MFFHAKPTRSNGAMCKCRVEAGAEERPISVREGLLSSLYPLSTESTIYALASPVLRSGSTRGHEVAEVFRRRKTGVVVRPAIDNLPSFVMYSRLALSACLIARSER